MKYFIYLVSFISGCSISYGQVVDMEVTNELPFTDVYVQALSVGPGDCDADFPCSTGWQLVEADVTDWVTGCYESGYEWFCISVSAGGPGTSMDHIFTDCDCSYMYLEGWGFITIEFIITADHCAHVKIY